MMVDQKHDLLSIRKQCKALGIWRSNVYYESSQNKDESILANEIRDLWLDMPAYGYRRITAELNRKGCDINHKRVLRLMRDMHIQALYPKPKTSVRNIAHKVYPYLLGDLSITKPNHVWATDITYIKMPQGFVYLTSLIDLYSRFIIGWGLSNTPDETFCEDALNRAFQYGKPEILNSDQGSQFTSEAWTSCLIKNNIKISMDGKGRWADNIIIERFWRTLKHEHVLLHAFESIKEIKESIGKFINMYNFRRLHQTLGYKTPAEVYFEQQKNGAKYILT
jgi:putative transposase